MHMVLVEGRIVDTDTVRWVSCQQFSVIIFREHPMRSVASLVLAAVLCLALPPSALAAQRVALVIGNSGYATSPLVNPVNDARAMAAKLEALGFEVILHADADLRTMEDATETFYRRLKGAEAGLFYYAGHGMQTGGENYLLPVDARINRESDLRYEAMAAGRVLGAMEDAGAPVNVVILDACRDNPFRKSFRSGSHGLAVVQAVRGSFVAFATSPGSVAADGRGDHGVFTKHILANIDTPGLAIEALFRKVRQGVMEETGGAQTPWDSSSLTGVFQFARRQAASGAGAGQTDPAARAMADELRKMREEMAALKAAATGIGQGTSADRSTAKYRVAVFPFRVTATEFRGKIYPRQNTLEALARILASPDYDVVRSAYDLEAKDLSVDGDASFFGPEKEWWSVSMPRSERIVKKASEAGADFAVICHCGDKPTLDWFSRVFIVDTATGRTIDTLATTTMNLELPTPVIAGRIAGLFEQYDDAHAKAGD